MNIVDLMFNQADHHSVALFCNSTAWTYGELSEACDLASRQLLRAGLPRRETGFVPRIGLACPNGTEHVILALAILRTGACLVPVPGELVGPERDTLIRTVGIHAIVIAGGMTWHKPLPQPAGTIHLRDFEMTFFLELQGLPGEPGFNETQFSELDPAFVRFSSGTTGACKGVVLSHTTLLDRIESANTRLEITPRDRVVWILPMAHHFAVSIMLYLLKGAATIVVKSHLPEEVLDAALEHGGTVLYGAPFHHALLAMESSGRPWPSLRLAVSTAAALPLETAMAFDARFNVPLSQGFGIIEVGLPLLNIVQPRQKPGSVGRPGDGVTIELRDPDTGQQVPPEAIGEVFVHAQGMFNAYLLPWQLQRDVLDQKHWFRTGDLARIDKEGFLYLVGRTKSVINIAGMKCFPEEVEAVLQAHPGVRAARVVGRKHPKFGNVPVAEIVTDDLSLSSEQLMEHCRNKLSRYKVPVDFEFVTELPRTANGKILRV